MDIKCLGFDIRVCTYATYFSVPNPVMQQSTCGDFFLYPRLCIYIPRNFACRIRQFLLHLYVKILKLKQEENILPAKNFASSGEEGQTLNFTFKSKIK